MASHSTMRRVFGGCTNTSRRMTGELLQVLVAADLADCLSTLQVTVGRQTYIRPLLCATFLFPDTGPSHFWDLRRSPRQLTMFHIVFSVAPGFLFLGNVPHGLPRDTLAPRNLSVVCYSHLIPVLSLRPPISLLDAAPFVELPALLLRRPHCH